MGSSGWRSCPARRCRAGPCLCNEPTWNTRWPRHHLHEERCMSLFHRPMADSEESRIRLTRKEPRMELTKAIRVGNLSVVKGLVRDEHLNFTYFYGTTFLDVAVNEGKSDIVKYLIEEKGVDVDGSSTDGRTPLHNAAAGGYYEIVKLLHINGADCNAVDGTGCSPCHSAAAKGRAKIIKFLVKDGKADINKRAEKGVSPFLMAARKVNDPSFLKLLIDLGADFTACDVNGHSALHFAGMYGHVSTVKFLIEEKHLDPNQRDNGGRNLLHLVLIYESTIDLGRQKEGRAEIAEYLVKGGKVNVNKVMDLGLTPLHLACLRQNLKTVKLLVDGGAYCDATDNKGSSPLHHSVLVGKLDIAKYLINETDAEVNGCDIEGRTLLHYACMYEKYDPLKLLRDNEIDMNSVDNLFRYCLHTGTMKDRADIVEYLIEEKKFDVNSGDEKAITSLHLVASYGHLELCKLLVKLGADYALRDVDGNSALHYAAMEGHVNIIEYFIKELGQVANKCINKLGTSPLHLACDRDDLDCVKFLVKNGADYKMLDEKGRSCLDLADKESNSKVFRYLVRKNNLQGDMNVRNAFGIPLLKRMMMFKGLAANRKDCRIS